MTEENVDKADQEYRISVIVPRSPFAPESMARLCLCALPVQELMDWWPGKTHEPHRDPDKVHAIQRSLDWNRVCEIASYLLQREISSTAEKIKKYFHDYYAEGNDDAWLPKVRAVVKYKPSVYPSIPNVLIHANGASIEVEDVAEATSHEGSGSETMVARNLIINKKNPKLSVIDGQHRINGAFLALKIRQETDATAHFDIPATVFLNLDQEASPPRNQAQIFIDVNFYQKKVDRSLVVDLFPTARGSVAVTATERAQDIGRRLMLETGPLVGFVQIPGIHYGLKQVVTLATLVSAIEGILPVLDERGITTLREQTQFIAMVIDGWLTSTKRKETSISDDNVVYQGRIISSVLTLIPAIFAFVDAVHSEPLTAGSAKKVERWFKEILERSGFLKRGRFMDRVTFKEQGFLGSGGIGRIRDILWASTDVNFKRKGRFSARITTLAAQQRQATHVAAINPTPTVED